VDVSWICLSSHWIRGEFMHVVTLCDEQTLSLITMRNSFAREQFTTAQRSGFLLYLNVKFVPFFAKILFGRDISIPTWISAFVAVLGTALLSWEGNSVDFNIGDVWSIAAAATSAMFILRLEAAASQVSDSGALNATCLWVVTIASFLWTLGQGIMDTSISTMETIPNIWDNVLHTIKSHPLALVYLSGVTTALANYIQTRAQKNVSAERASVIYAMDPVYGAMFSFWLLGERLTNFGMAGAALITIAAATNALLDLGKPLASAEGEFQVVNGGLKEETNGTMSHGSDEQSSR
jgi:drug/metabolite transporter (DMT)-like permease